MIPGQLPDELHKFNSFCDCGSVLPILIACEKRALRMHAMTIMPTVWLCAAPGGQEGHGISLCIKDVIIRDICKMPGRLLALIN